MEIEQIAQLTSGLGVSPIVTVLVMVFIYMFKIVVNSVQNRETARLKKYERSASSNDHTTGTGETLRETISYLIEHSKQTDKRLIELEKERDSLLARIRYLEGEIIRLKQSLDDKEEQINKLQGERNSLKTRVQELEKELASLDTKGGEECQEN